MKCFSTIIAGFCMVLCLASCSSSTANAVSGKSGKMVQKRLNLGAFSAINNYSTVDVDFVQADSTSILLRGSAEDLKYVSVTRKGNALTIESKEKPFYNGDFGDVKVIVSSPNLVALDNSGTGDFRCTGVLDTDKLNVIVNGTGDVDFSDVVCDYMKVSMGGTGDFGAKRVEAVKVNVDNNGTGDATISVRNANTSSFRSYGTGDMNVRFDNCGTASCVSAGTGDITLSGTVRQLTKNASGTGEVETKNLKVM